MRLSTLLLALVALPAAAQTPQPLPFTQDWTDTGLITTLNDWSGVPGVIGYRGDDLTTAIGADAQTVVADGSATPVNVNANQTSPSTFTAGGISEFEIANPTVALNGSGTADAPHIVIRVNTTGAPTVRVRYNVRDLDDSADDAVQQVALQYRVGTSGDFTNVPEAYIPDATTANAATQETLVDVALPAEAAGQPSLDIRILTVNSAGNDEWVGIDDIQITGGTVAGEAGPTTGLALTLPNPVAGTATVRYAAPTADVRLALYDALGRRVATLAPAGGVATLDVQGLAPGAYVLRLDAAGRSLTRLVSVAR